MSPCKILLYNQKMKQFASFILTFILLALCHDVSAQSFLDTLRKTEAGKGQVTVSQSVDIDVLVNGKKPVETSNAAATASTKNEANKPEAPKTVATPSIGDNADIDVTVDTRKKVMRNSYKVNGFRIQAFSGGNSRVDRQKAEQIGANLKRVFPNQPIYVHFYSPSWKCRMGNFRDQAEAQKVLKQVKAIYPQACIIKGPISVQY